MAEGTEFNWRSLKADIALCDCLKQGCSMGAVGLFCSSGGTQRNGLQLCQGGLDEILGRIHLWKVVRHWGTV